MIPRTELSRDAKETHPGAEHVDQERTSRYRGDFDGFIRQHRGSIRERLPDVLFLQLRVISSKLLPRVVCAQSLEHAAHCEAQPADAGLPFIFPTSMVIRSKAVDADISSLAFVNYNCSSLLFRRRGRTHYALDQV